MGFQIAMSLENIRKDSLKVNDLHTATQAPIIAIAKIGYFYPQSLPDGFLMARPLRIEFPEAI
jgi:hypothetical protein